MRVRTDGEGFVTLRLRDFPNAVFDIDIVDYSDDEDWSGTEVHLTRVDPRDDPEDREVSPALQTALEQIEALAISLGRDPRLGRRAMQLDRSSKLAVVEQAQQARVEAIAAKFTGSTTPNRKAG